jgi:hypothetical protein
MGGAWIWVVGGMRREGRKEASKRACYRRVPAARRVSKCDVSVGRAQRQAMFVVVVVVVVVLVGAADAEGSEWVRAECGHVPVESTAGAVLRRGRVGRADGTE